MFLEDVKVVKVKDASAAAQTAVNSDVIDMQGFESVAFLLNAGAVTAAGVQSINVAESDTGDGNGMADIASSKINVADDDDNQAFATELIKPKKRYVRLEIARATQDSAFGPIWAFLSGAHVKPVNNNRANEITSEIHVSAAEGTA